MVLDSLGTSTKWPSITKISLENLSKSLEHWKNSHIEQKWAMQNTLPWKLMKSCKGQRIGTAESIAFWNVFSNNLNNTKQSFQRPWKKGENRWSVSGISSRWLQGTNWRNYNNSSKYGAKHWTHYDNSPARTKHWRNHDNSSKYRVSTDATTANGSKYWTKHWRHHNNSSTEPRLTQLRQQLQVSEPSTNAPRQQPAFKPSTDVTTTTAKYWSQASMQLQQQLQVLSQARMKPSQLNQVPSQARMKPTTTTEPKYGCNSTNWARYWDNKNETSQLNQVLSQHDVNTSTSRLSLLQLQTIVQLLPTEFTF